MDSKRRLQLRGLAAAAATLAAPAWAQGVVAPDKAGGKKVAPMPQVGTPFPLPGAVELIDGSTLHTRDWAGKVVVLEYWATWCPFCARQMPLVQKLYAKERARGLEVLAVSIDRAAAEVPPYVKQKGYTFPVAWMSPELGRVLPKPAGLPVTIVIGRDGKVAMADAGELFAEDVAGIARFL